MLPNNNQIINLSKYYQRTRTKCRDSLLMNCYFFFFGGGSLNILILVVSKEKKPSIDLFHTKKNHQSRRILPLAGHTFLAFFS